MFNLLRAFKALAKTNKNTPTIDIKPMPTVSQHSGHLSSITANLQNLSDLTKSDLTQPKDK